MNAVSLAYSSTENQQSSWKDDPFDLNKKGFVTGVTPMSYERSLKDCALDLVESYGEFIGNRYELNFDKLSFADQLQLVRLYIESIDREIEWACYGDDQTMDSSFLCSMLAMLKDFNPKTRADFARVTLNNLLVYYKNSLQNILDATCDEYYSTQVQNDIYYHEQDNEQGNLSWKS